ncbi:MAG: glycosyltransferase family 39 protein, partial [Acidobacteria bacterium]|nr:glycosyltransferase family 39 protein [Acidobacteriota bacterium]
MAHAPRPSSFPRWVALADGFTLALVVLAAAIVVTGGLRVHVWGLALSVTGAWRPAVCAALVAAVRHAAFRGDSLWRRLTRLFGPLGDPFLEPHDGAPIPAREIATVAALMAAATLVMTCPQVFRLDAVKDLGDPLFSIWRLAWVAHQIVRDPLHLFEANLYYPSRLTLAYSDSMVLPGILTAPFFWLGVPAVPLYNVVLLSTFVLAGVAMYVLVRSLTGHRPAAWVAGVAFAFYPFRFQHYYQMELLWACWMPLVLWAVHRTLSRGRWRDGLMAGGAFAAQMLSCMYFGLFLAAYLVPVGGTLAFGSGRLVRAVKPLAAGAVLASVLLVPLVWPYAHARQELGERSPSEVLSFSSTPQDYLVAQQTNVVWGNLLGRGSHGPEDSFPGIVIVVLALVA